MSSLGNPGEQAGKSKIDVDEILNKYDKETAYRQFGGNLKYLVTGICVLFSLFHLGTAAFGVFPAQIQRAVHLSFAMTLIFLLYPATKNSPRNRVSPIDLCLIAVSLLVCLYPVVFYEDIVRRGGLINPKEIYLGAIAIIVLMEATRRIVGLPITLVAGSFLLYARFGKFVPGLLKHKGFSLSRIISHMYLTTEGIWGLPLGVSSTYVFLFILFGAFLYKSGLGKFFIDAAFALTGHRVGGPAKVAVLSSALFGTISGSSVANTITTGVFTIPMMESLGYPPVFAGAVAASASTGGQIVPPIMGAAAFIMAQFLGIAYIDVAIAAIVPAVLYYFALGVMVHMQARRMGLQSIPKEKLPDFRVIFRERAHLLIPIAAIVYFLVTGYTPLYSALMSIITTVAVSMLKASTRLDLKSIADALESGAKSALGVAAACACAGIIIGVVTLSGAGLKIANTIVDLAQGKLILTLFFTMIASLILGMGLPTTAKYIILASMAAPAIQKFGVPPIAAHLFILYFGIMADITPPVALAAFAASSLSGANAMSTGFVAVKLAIAGFIVPYAFVYHPELLSVNSSVGATLFNGLSAMIGTFALAVAATGFWKRNLYIPERLLMVGASLALIMPGIYSDLAGLAAMIAVWKFQDYFPARAPGKAL